MIDDGASQVGQSSKIGCDAVHQMYLSTTQSRICSREPTTRGEMT